MGTGVVRGHVLYTYTVHDVVRHGNRCGRSTCMCGTHHTPAEHQQALEVYHNTCSSKQSPPQVHYLCSWTWRNTVFPLLNAWAFILFRGMFARHLLETGIYSSQLTKPLPSPINQRPRRSHMASKYESKSYQKASAVKEHYIYKVIWMPTIAT